MAGAGNRSHWTVTPGRQTEPQKAAIAAAEALLKSRTPNAVAASHTLTGIKKALSSANVVTGMFHQYAKPFDIAVTKRFFDSYKAGGLDQVGKSFHYWKDVQRELGQ